MIVRTSQPVMARKLAKGAALALFASVSPLAISPVQAQEAPAAPAVAEVGPTDIIVTATKRSESVQKVPISITALSAAALEQHHVNSFDDYAKMLPSISYQSFGPSQSQLYFRGIATGGDGIALGPLPAAGMYIDETPVTTIYGSVDLHVYDMSRIEALSGPQGTLYGASSLSGTLRLITNAPVIGKWEGGIDGELNKFGPGNAGGKVEGFLNVPISDNVAARVVGFWQHDGGYISNTAACRTYQRTATSATAGPGIAVGNNPLTVCNSPTGAPAGAIVDNHAGKNQNDVTSAGGRAALKVNLDENWTVSPMLVYQHQIAHGTFLYGPEINGAGDLQVHDFTPERNKDEFYLASMTVQGKISNWDVTYNGSYFERWVDTLADYSYFTVGYDQLYSDYTDFATATGQAIDPTQIFHSHDHYTKMSHELRVSSPSDKPFRLTAGAFMQRQTDYHQADYIISGLSSDPAPAVSPVDAAHPDDVYYTGFDRIDRDYAAFAEANWDITHNVTLTGGIRGFIADNTLEGFSGSAGTLTNAANTYGCTTVTVATCPSIHKKYTGEGETHRASIKWQVDRDKMLYFTYSTGFRPGGNNRSAYFQGNVQNPKAFAADTLTNYELGWKTSWLHHTLRLNGALFWEDWSNVQYALPGIQGIFYTVNAGTARSRGFEGEAAWNPTPALTLSASGTYVDAKLTSDFCDQVNGCAAAGGTTYAVAGTRLPVTPRVKVNGSARYEMPVGAYKAYLQAAVNYQSNTTTYLRNDWETIANAAGVGTLKGFATVDFGAGLKKDRWTLDLFINNAFDKRGIVGINQSCSASPCIQDARLLPTKPQQFGIRSGIKF